MLNGYITYDELKIITGYPDKVLRNLLLQGMSQHQINVNANKLNITQQVFNLDEVVKWISIHLF